MFKKLLPSGNVLEIGAGTGRDAKELIALGYDYTGSDVSEELLNIARKEVPAAKFVAQSLYDLNFPKKFDGFWASAVLLHVPKKRIDEAFASIKSTLKPGAVGFISIKDGEGEELQKRKMGGIETDRFFCFWRKDNFDRTLEKHNFKIEYYDHRIVTKNTHWHCYIVRFKQA